MAVLVRSAELACRTDWGTTCWEPNPSDFLIELKIWGPFPPSGPLLDDLPNDLIVLLMDGER